MLKISLPKTFTCLSIVAPGYLYLPRSMEVLPSGGAGGAGGAGGRPGSAGSPATGICPTGGCDARIAEYTITPMPTQTSRTHNRVINTHFNAPDFLGSIG